MSSQLKLNTILLEKKYSPEKMAINNINFNVGVYFDATTGIVKFESMTSEDAKKIKQDINGIRNILKSKASSVLGEVTNTKTYGGVVGTIAFKFPADLIEKNLEKRIAK